MIHMNVGEECRQISESPETSGVPTDPETAGNSLFWKRLSNAREGYSIPESKITTGVFPSGDSTAVEVSCGYPGISRNGQKD